LPVGNASSVGEPTALAVAVSAMDVLEDSGDDVAVAAPPVAQALTAIPINSRLTSTRLVATMVTTHLTQEAIVRSIRVGGAMLALGEGYQ
jgi:hypothetical protein